MPIDAHRRVVQLGGSVSSNLTTSVTHVVTKDTSLFCRKYHVSAKVGIPVVSLDFISECELEARERSSGTPDSDTSEAVRQITERNRFPPFAGCRISSTGFSADMRKEIERLVENSELASATSLLAGRMADSLLSCPIRSSELIGGGGLYCGVLTSDCTHLIALNPEGEKFKFAKARSIPIVSLEWLVQCLIARARQKEDEYLVAGGPTPSGTAAMAPSVTNLRRLQSLGRAQPGPGQTDGPATGSHGYRVHASAPGSDRTLSTTLVHPGIPSTRESVASSGALRQEGQMASITRNCTRAASSGLDFVDAFDLPPGLVESPRMDTEDDSDVVVVINQPDAPAPGLRPPQPPLPRGARMVFKSCRIALSQASLSLARRNEWRAKVVAAGGDCVSEDSTISAPQHVNPWTHFVVDDSDELCAEDIRVLQLVHAATATDRPLVVQCGWLRECWRSGRRAKESTFSIPWPELSVESGVSALARRVPKRQPGLQPMVGRPLTSSAMDDSEFGLLTTDSRHNAKKRGIASSSNTDYEHLGDMNPKHPRRLVDGLDTPVITIDSGGKADDVSLAVFARCVFTSLGLTASATAKFKQVVQENGGVYTDVFGGYSNATPEQPRAQAPILPLDRALNTLAGHIDDTSFTDAYIVIPFHGVNELDMCVAAQKRYKSMRIVTECWVDQCVHDGRRYPDYHTIQDLRLPYPGLSAGQHIVFRPLESTRVADAEAMSLSISGYEGTERDHIGMLAQALGITFSERLPRKTTHLICRRPFNGLKYQRALKWGIQVVDSTWFYDLVAAGQTGGLGKGDAGQKVVPSWIAAADTSDREAEPEHNAMPGLARQPLTPLTRPSQQLLLLGTPGRTPMDVSLERNIQQALGNNRLRRRVGLGSEDGGIGDVGCDSDATQMSPTRWQPGCSTGPSTTASMSTGDGAGGLTTVLEGAVIAISSRILCRRDELTVLAQQLGCRVLPRFDAKEATHLVHQSNRERETLRDYQLALQNGVHVVSPWWLYECRDTASAAPEANFPYTYNRDRRLMLVTTSQALPKQQRQESSATSAGSSHQQVSPSQCKLSNAKPKHEYFLHAAASTADATNPGPLELQGMNSASAMTDTHEIGSLFGKKAAGTRRKYRQAVDGVGHDDSASETAGQLARLQELQRHSLSDVPSSEEPTSGSGALGEGAYLTQQGQLPGAQTPDKWWLNAEPTASGRFAAEYQASMYSQDLPPSSCHGLDSLLCTNAPADSADLCPNSHFEPRQLPFHGESQARQTTAGNSAGVLVSSPLVAHKTTIVYGEDAEALSERDQLIRRLIGR